MRIYPFLLILISAVHVFGSAQEDAAINRHIHSKEVFRSKHWLSENLTEYREARKISKGSIRETYIIAVQYTLEVGNNWIIRLAVFSPSQKMKLLGDIRVGEKGWRSVDLTDVTEGTINFKTYNYGRGDPMGDPSLIGETHYSFSDDGLEEREARIHCANN